MKDQFIFPPFLLLFPCTLGKSVFASQKQILNPVLLHLRKVVCSGLFTFGFPSVLSLVPRCASTVLGLSLPFSLSFQTDDGEVWMQCVGYASRINTSNSVCLTSIHAGSTSLCRLTAAVEKGTLISALAEASFHPWACVTSLGGQPCPHAHG